MRVPSMAPAVRRAWCVAIAAALALSGCSLIGGSAPPEVEPDDVILGVGFVGVQVDDVEAASAYYAGALAAVPVAAAEIEPAGAIAGLLGSDALPADVQLMRSANAQLLLMNLRPASPKGAGLPAVPVQGPGIAHVCFQVARTTDSYDKILAAGASSVGVRGLVQLNARNPVHYGYVKDPQGIITEIEEVDVAALDLPEPPKNTHRIRHVSLATPDLGAMIDFYRAFLGGQEPRHVGSWFNVSGEAVDKVSGLTGSKLEMAWFQIRNLELEIFQYHSHPTKRPAAPRPLDAPGYNMIAFDVSDLGEARKRLVGAGGTVVLGPVAFAGGEAIFGRDPDGNLLVLHKVSPSSPFSAANFADNGLR